MNTIQAIETIPIRVPLDRIYRGSYYQMRTRCTIITRLRTSDGIIGEAYNADSDEEQDEILRIIEKELAPAVIGRDATNLEGAWEAMQFSTYDQLRDRRLAMQAIACVDSAMWDAFGKRVGLPLYKLWGGYRDALPAIGIGGGLRHDAKALPAEGNVFLFEAFSATNVQIGVQTATADDER